MDFFNVSWIVWLKIAENEHGSSLIKYRNTVVNPSYGCSTKFDDIIDYFYI